MVDLSNARFLGKGSSRVCYVHPEDQCKCVKITYSQNSKVAREEMKYYRRYLKRGVSWDMMAETYGCVSTTLGEGVVFSLARDHTGQISASLDSYLRAEAFVLHGQELFTALQSFRSYLLRERIIVRELKADNLIYQRVSPDEGRLILVDGVGNNEFLPVANYSGLFARRTLKRKWSKFEHSLLLSYPDNVMLQKVVSMLRHSS